SAAAPASFAAFTAAAPVSISAALICSGNQDGCAALTSAAMPVVCGAAIDVPLSFMPSLPVPTAVEKTETPGAAMSGLTTFGSPQPRDENDAILSVRD